MHKHGLAKKTTSQQAGRLSASATGACDAGGSDTRSLAFRGLFDRRRQASPQTRTTSLFKNDILFVGYEDIVSGGPSHEFSSPTA